MIKTIKTNGYENCTEITNEKVRVVIEPNYGGRVLYYELHGKNALFVDERENGYMYGNAQQPPLKNLSPCAGRFDIGPEMTIDAHPQLWYGKYSTQIIDEFTVKITSVEDEVTGVQVERIFELDDETSHLSCTQVVKNISQQVKQYFHWSRTFGQGGGICLVPLNPNSRYPKGYLMYGPGEVMDYQPAPEENVKVENGLLQVVGPPERAKFAVDSFDGWLAYITKNNLLFIKKFPCYPDAVYGEMAANTISVWYNQEMMTELEPIGPVETIKPGETFSFTEDWFLEYFEYPQNKKVDCQDVMTIVENC